MRSIMRASINESVKTTCPQQIDDFDMDKYIAIYGIHVLIYVYIYMYIFYIYIYIYIPAIRCGRV